MRFKSFYYKRHKQIAAILAFVMAAIMILGVLLQAVYADEKNAAVTMEVTVGFDQKYKVGGETPFQVLLTNEGKGFQGELQIKVMQQDYGNGKSYILYTQPVDLSTQSAKKFDLTMQVPMLQRSFEILLVSGGKTVTRKVVYCTAFSPESTVIGVLTEDEDSLGYLKMMKLQERRGDEGDVLKNALIFLNENTFPEKQGVLNNFQAIFINNYDISRLTEGQRKALQEWIQAGGVLMLGTGPNAGKVLKGFDKTFIPVTETGSRRISALSLLEERVQIPMEQPGEMIVSQMNVIGGKPILSADEASFITELGAGNGQILIHHFDLGLAPFVHWKGNSELLTRLYVEHIPAFQVNADVARDRYYQSIHSTNTFALRLIPDLNGDKLIWMLGMIGFYTLLVGPILYLILKKLDRREQGWVLIPAVAVGFTAIIYFLSLGTGYRGPIGSSVATVYMEEDSQIANVDLAMGVFAPSKGEVQVTIPEHMKVQMGVQDMYYRPDPQNQEIITSKIQLGEESKITLYNKQSWGLNTFSSSSSRKMDGAIKADLTLEDNMLVGKIYNETDFELENAVLMIGSDYHVLGTVEKRGQVEVRKAISTSVNQNSFQMIQQVFGDVYNSAKMKEMLKQGSTKDDLRKMVQRRNILESYFNRQTQSYYYGMKMAATAVSASRSSAKINTSAAGIPIVLYGFNEEMLEEGIQIDGKEIYSFHQNMFVVPLRLDFEKMNTFDIPYGFIQPYSIAADVGFDAYEYDNAIYTHGKGTLDIRFKIPVELDVETFQIRWTGTSGFPHLPQIFNGMTQEWEDMDFKGYENTATYLDEERMIHIRLASQEGTRIEYPAIRLKGGK